MSPTIEKSSAEWNAATADLTVRRDALVKQVEKLRADKNDITLWSLLGNDKARKRSANIAEKLRTAAAELEDLDTAIDRASRERQNAEQSEGATAEQSRRKQIAEGMAQYTEAVREIDDTLRHLASKFVVAKQTLDRVEALMNRDEKGRVQQLRTLWGLTLAAAHFGIGNFVQLGPQAGHVIPHGKPLGDFVSPFTSAWKGTKRCPMN